MACHHRADTVGADDCGGPPGGAVGERDADAIIGEDEFHQGFFPSRWDRATPSERRYLRAIANTGEEAPKTSSLSIPQRAAGPFRAALIKKGIVYSPEHGRISFTVPGMAAFIARQPDDDEEN
jgi:hypothetical protein